MRAAHLLVAITIALASLATAGVLAVLVTRGDGSDTTSAVDAAARTFLDEYVDADGRVVRHDQGGDTVSEGQAYAMLVAAATGDRERFDAVWQWTQDNLERPDGLLSWRWAEGQVVDDESAADADLDAARALVVAGKRFDDETLTADGIRLGEAVLDEETVRTDAGRVLVAGTWVVETPYAVNPSYVSPVATSVLGAASDDPRWAKLEAGSRAVVEDLVDDGRLPPDWAEIQGDGSVRATAGPDGQPERFGYDAARTVLRHAESCEEVDQDLAARARDLLARPDRAYAVYDLAGSPQTDVVHPLSYAALAAAHAASGEDEEARAALDEADAAQRENPTYYGAAWAALGRLMLQDGALLGCPPLDGS